MSRELLSKDEVFLDTIYTLHFIKNNSTLTTDVSKKEGVFIMKVLIKTN